MWFTMFRAFKPEKIELAKHFIELEKTVYAQMGASLQRGIFEARVHGYPLVETGQVIWHESTNTIRSQMDSWQIDGALDSFKAVGDTYTKTEGQFLIDVDDPELLELGEEGVHKQLTDYLAEFCNMDGDDPNWPKELVDAVVNYTDESLFCNLDPNGGIHPPPALVIASFRRSRGFPYEWFGAPID